MNKFGNWSVGGPYSSLVCRSHEIAQVIMGLLYK